MNFLENKNNMIKIFLSISFLFVATFSNGQTFPLAVHPADSFLLNANKTKICTVGNDTLWIIKQNMFNKMLQRGLDNKLLEEELKLYLQKEISYHTIIDAYKRDTIILSDLYHHYLSLWEATDKKLEDSEIKLVKEQRLKWNVGICGVLVGVIACMLIK